MTETSYVACPTCGRKKEFQPKASYLCDLCGTYFEVPVDHPAARAAAVAEEQEISRTRFYQAERILVVFFLLIVLGFGAGLYVLETRDARLFSGRFSPDHRFAACGGPGGLILYDREQEEIIYQDKALYPRPDSFAFSAAGDRLAVGLWNGDILVMDVPDAAAPLRLRGHEGGVSAVAFLPGGDRLVSSSDDGFVRVWDLAAAETVLSLDAHLGYAGVGAMALSPAGRYIASGAVVKAEMDFEIKLWSAESGRLLARRQYDPYCYVRQLVFAPDGETLLALLSDSRIIAWDVSEITEPAPVLECKDGDCRPVSSDLRSGFEEQGAPRNDAGLNRLSFAEDGRRLAACGYGEIRLWSWSLAGPFSGRRLAQVPGDVWDVSFAGANTLYSVGEDGQVRQWDLDTGTVIKKSGGVSARARWPWVVLAAAAILWTLLWLPLQIATRAGRFPADETDNSGHCITAAAVYFLVWAALLYHGMTATGHSFVFDNITLFPLVGLVGLILLVILLTMPFVQQGQAAYRPFAVWTARLTVLAGIVLSFRFFLLVVAAV